MKCFYHSADLDGHCSGAIVKRRWPECEMIGINYGDEFPWDALGNHETVFMVDFCLQPFSGMVAILGSGSGRCERPERLVWIDHHKSAIESAGKEHFMTHGALDTQKAACELTWDYLFPGEEMPEAVWLLGRYDVWDLKADDAVLPFQWGMRLIEDTRPGCDVWDRIFRDDGHSTEFAYSLIAEGRIALKYQAQLSRKICGSTVFDVEFEGLRCVASNNPMCNSQHFQSVFQPNRHDAMLSFYLTGKGFWTVSLYSDNPGVDVSTVAVKHGGGGHAGAAGFQCKELPFCLGA